MHNIEDILDLERYPLNRLATVEGHNFVENCRRQINEQGACLLPGFLLPAAIEAALDDALNIASTAHQVDHFFAYDDVNDDKLHASIGSLPANHPRRFQSLTNIRFVAKDLIDHSNPIKVIHGWNELTAFIGAVMGMNPVYPSACPLSSCVITIAEQDELQDWHFDGNEFIVTLMLQAAKEGGDFEYVTGLRDKDGGDDFENISAVLEGKRDNVLRPAIEAGTLTLFKGKYNLHRASPVGEDSCRVMAILSYENRPGVTGSNDFLKLFYGRSLQDL